MSWDNRIRIAYGLLALVWVMMLVALALRGDWFAVVSLIPIAAAIAVLTPWRPRS